MGCVERVCVMEGAGTWHREYCYTGRVAFVYTGISAFAEDEHVTHRSPAKGSISF